MIVEGVAEVRVIGNATLYRADALALLPTLVGIDAVVTDPPYGIRHSSARGQHAVKGKASWAGRTIVGDNDTGARDAVVGWLGGRPGAFCGTWKRPPPSGTRAAIVWDKGPAFGMGDLRLPWKPSWEVVFIVGQGWSAERRGEGVLRGPSVVTWESRGRKHPHQKPEWLMEHFIERLPAAGTILDPFMGSGTTGVAALRQGRQFVGIELDQAHFETACMRIEAGLSKARPLGETRAA